MRHAALEWPQRLSRWRCVSTAGERETQGSGTGAGVLAFGLRASRLSPLPARWQTTAPSSVFRGIHGTLRRTSAAVRERRGKETGTDRDRIEGHKRIALTSMARAASRSRMGRSSGAAAEQQRSSSGAATVNRRTAWSRSEASWVDLPFIWTTLSIFPVMVSQWFMKERRVC